jgi:hypothetical protein
MDVKGCNKLGPKYFGPYQIRGRVGDMAYRLHLPEGVQLHDVFHVGLLKQFNGEPPAAMVGLPPIRHGRVCLKPADVTKSRFARGRHELLVNWKGKVVADA